MAGPPDEDAENEQILAQLLAAPAEAWAELEAALTALETDEAPMTWDGGESRTAIVDGEEHVVTTMPYAVYSESAERLRRALPAVGAVFVYDWISWPRLNGYPGGAGLDAAPVTDAVRLATAVLRSERFTEGSYGGAIADGLVAAIVRRLLHWRRDEALFRKQ